MSYVVNIEGFDSKEYRFRVQDNTGGVFGSVQQVTLPAEHFKDMSMEEVKKTVAALLEWDFDFQEDEARADRVEERVEDRVAEKNNNPVINLPRPSYVLLAAAICLFGGTFGYMFVWGDSNAQAIEEVHLSPQEQIHFLTSEVERLRSEREQQYNTCQAKCDAGRLERDAEVTSLKGQKKLLELGG